MWEKDKTFDCMKMKAQGERAVYEKVKGMTLEQEIEYWRRRNGEFLAAREAARARKVPKDP